MRERAKEARAAKKGADGERALLDAIKQMPPAERKLAEDLHALIRQVAPQLTCRTWYGMPAYEKDGKVLCFYQAASKFGTRYGTLGFSDQAQLDKDSFWPTSYAITEISDGTAKKITTLVKRAAR